MAPNLGVKPTLKYTPEKGRTERGLRQSALASGAFCPAFLLLAPKLLCRLPLDQSLRGCFLFLCSPCPPLSPKLSPRVSASPRMPPSQLLGAWTRRRRWGGETEEEGRGAGGMWGLEPGKEGKREGGERAGGSRGRRGERRGRARRARPASSASSASARRGPGAGWAGPGAPPVAAPPPRAPAPPGAPRR